MLLLPWLKRYKWLFSIGFLLSTSLGGVLISWFVGYKTYQDLEYKNQVVEAAFRKELVYGEDDRS